MKEAKEQTSSEDINMLLVGTKSDLVELRQIPKHLVRYFRLTFLKKVKMFILLRLKNLLEMYL